MSSNEWEAPNGERVQPKDEDENSFIIDLTISACSLLVVGTACLLVLHWAGVV